MFNPVGTFILAAFTAGLAQASLAEFFGSGAKSQALAGQSVFDSGASANYHSPSTLAFKDKISYSFNLTRVDFNFKEIENVLVSSPVNSNPDDPEKYGDFSPDYDSQEILSLHAIFPLFKFNRSKLGLSVFTPFSKFLEAGTGDPYRPEYSLYRNRFLRAIFHVNYIQPLSDTVSFSLGISSGIRSKGETYVVANDSGSEYPSSGKIGFDAAPVFSLAASISKKWSKSYWTYFSFQEENESRLENEVSGVTPLGSSSLAYNLAASSMLFYDPRIYRLGHNLRVANSEIFATIEYQDWSGYESPRLNLENQGGILVSSREADNFRLRNVWIPRIGARFILDEWSLLSGLAYRPSPLELIDEAPGNQVDADAAIASVGFELPFEFRNEKMSFQLGAQYQQLIEKTVKKKGPRENGEPGDKIGSPSYKVGGHVATISVGLSWSI